VTRRVLLRDYQEECLEAIRARFAAGVRRQLVVLPTGAGKTMVAAHLPARMGWPRTLFLVHREELVRQAVDTFRASWPGLEVGVERAGERSGGEPVVVASVQTVCREPRLSEVSSGGWGLVIVDEAHHAVASSYRRVISAVGASDRAWRGLLLGITATSRRGDGVGLWPVFDEVVYSRTMLDMIEAGYLVPVRGYLVRTGVSISGVRVRRGDFDERQLSAAVNTPQRNETVVNSYVTLARGRRAVVFCADVAHAISLAFEFRKKGVRAEAVHGAMPQDARSEVLGLFRDGRLNVVTNVGVLTEGYDDPGIDCVVMARPTCSGLLYTQMVGRGVRRHPGKRDCVVIDLLDMSRKHARNLVTLPTLFGLPPGFDLRGKSAGEVWREYSEAARKLQQHGVPEDLAMTPEDIRAMTVEVDLLRLAMVPPSVASASDLVWQRMPDGSYVAPVGGGVEVLVRENVMSRWDVLTVHPGGAMTKHGECFTPEDAVRFGSKVIRDLYPEAVPLLLKSAGWRGLPATEKQVATLRRLGVDPRPGLTRGEASLIIARSGLARESDRQNPSSGGRGSLPPEAPGRTQLTGR